MLFSNKYGVTAVLILLFSLFFSTVSAEVLPQDKKIEQDAYVESIVLRARKNKLHREKYWHVLLHYKKNYFGYESLIDDPSFFCAKDGKDDPAKELEETIRAFFSAKKENVVHPTSKYPARFKWLRDRLSIDMEKLPYNGENDYKKFYDKINPGKILIVFPAGYMNSPASMYGHTLVVIESEEGNRHTATAANYAAITNETFGPIFAFKGLFGLYKGYFSYLPYYKKISEYSDGDKRDMWEYELNLTKEEIDMSIRHMVEMENVYSYYYFLDENCSYNLLYLIEVARPESGLTGKFKHTAEPIETLKAVIHSNMVKKRQFRPSLYTKIQYYRNNTTGKEQDLVKEFCKGDSDITAIKDSGLSNERKVLLYDFCAEYLKFRLSNQDIEPGVYRRKFFNVLKARSAYRDIKSSREIPQPPPPETAHGSSRIGISGGHAPGGYYTGLQYRITCHNKLDRDEGYTRNAQIIFGNLKVRYYPETKKPVLQRFDIMDLVSLPASDSFFLSACWDLKTGFRQVFDSLKEEKIAYYIKASSGLSTNIFTFAQLYAFAGFDSNFAPGFQHNTDFTAGGEGGMILTLGFLKEKFYSKYYRSFQEDTYTHISLGTSAMIHFSPNTSFLINYSYNKKYDYRYHATEGVFSYYF